MFFARGSGGGGGFGIVAGGILLLAFFSGCLGGLVEADPFFRGAFESGKGGEQLSGCGVVDGYGGELFAKVVFKAAFGDLREISGAGSVAEAVEDQYGLIGGERGGGGV